MNPKNFQRLLKKLKHEYKRRWYGHLLPSEILELHTRGADFGPNPLLRAQKDIAEGRTHAWPTSFGVAANTPLEKSLLHLQNKSKAA